MKIPSLIGELHGWRRGRPGKFSLQTCDKIRELFVNGASYITLARRYGTSSRTIHKILRGQYIAQRAAVGLAKRRAAIERAAEKAAKKMAEKAAASNTGTGT